VTGSPSRAALAIFGTMGRLAGKCTLVTGGTTGLGLAIQPAVREERGDQADRPVIRLASGRCWCGWHQRIVRGRTFLYSEESNEDSAGTILAVPVPIKVPEGWPEPSGARDPRTLAVLPAMRELLPHGGLACGSVVAVAEFGLLCLALAAAASAAGAWCAIIGVPEAGIVAAAGLGLDAGRILLVPDPGPAWPQVTASLLDGCEIVVLRPPGPATAQVRRRLDATLRRRRGVLLVAGDWPGPRCASRSSPAGGPAWATATGGCGHAARRSGPTAEGQARRCGPAGSGCPPRTARSPRPTRRTSPGTSWRRTRCSRLRGFNSGMHPPRSPWSLA
jgi:hypothetical protein